MKIQNAPDSQLKLGLTAIGLNDLALGVGQTLGAGRAKTAINIRDRNPQNTANLVEDLNVDGVGTFLPRRDGIVLYPDLLRKLTLGNSF